MKIFVAEMHHHVLTFWARWRRESHAGAPAVLVLDHHTDVVRAFRKESEEIPSGIWQNPEQVAQAVTRLQHDEHFDWALRSGLISEMILSSEVNATPCAHPAMKVRTDPRWQDENHVFAQPEKFRSLADSVLESDYLAARFGEQLPENFILDIDCDYFATAKAFHPEDDVYFQDMVHQAKLITVSLERDWVRLLRFPGETFDAEEILRTLFPEAEFRNS